MISLHFADK